MKNDKTIAYLKEIIQLTQSLSERIDQLHENEIDDDMALSAIERRKIAKIYEQTIDSLQTLKSLQYQARERRRIERNKAKAVIKPKTGLFSGRPKEEPLKVEK